MRFPFVSRERYDELKAEHAALLREHHALLKAQSTDRPARQSVPRSPQPARDPLVDKLTADLEGVLGDKATARAEAERIKREAFGG